MLSHIFIQNYALIDTLSLDISSGFTVITGETGAGKSIIMGALSLVLGQRSDSKVLRNPEQKCIVEVTFQVQDYGLEPLFEQLELDYDNECVVRREIMPNGKSRAFINDTPLNLNQLKEVTSHLIDIHSQHENLLLNEADFQRDLVDIVAQSDNELLKYQAAFRLFKAIDFQLNETLQLALQWQQEKDYALFQFTQISEAQLQVGEQDQLERSLERLNHVEEIKQELAQAFNLLDNDEMGIISQLKGAIQSIEKVIKYLPSVGELADRSRSAWIELRDLSSQLETLVGDTEFDPNEKDSVEKRLDLIYTLQQKHHVSSVEELLQLQEEYDLKLQRIEAFDEEIETLQNQRADALKSLDLFAQALSIKRKSIGEYMKSELVNKLVSLGIKNAQIEIMFEQIPYSPNGIDKVVFLFSANKNSALNPIASIASGGEIARVMLGLKSLIVSRSALPTIIFDEIDTGVSGEIAHRMGEMMREMSANMQVITITHLPQIAAKGKGHLKVYKSDSDVSTETHLIVLKPEERVQEIAEMLSGKNPTEASLLTAQELLK